MLDLRLVQTFREVALRGSFSLAAEELGYTQPAVSQHISRLEKHFATRLLERDARGVSLTAAGEALLSEADAILAAVRRAEAAVRAADGQSASSLRVAAFQTAAGGLVPGAARRLRRSHTTSAVELDLVVMDPDPGMRAVLRGKADIALVIHHELAPIEAPEGLELLPITKDQMLVALACDHPLAAQRSICLGDLADEPWLLTELGGSCADSNIVLGACRDAGFAPTVRLESEDYHALQGMAAAGLGVALVPLMGTVGTHPDVVIRPLRGRSPERDVLAAVRAGERSPIVEEFVDALRAAGRELAGAPELTLVA